MLAVSSYKPAARPVEKPRSWSIPQHVSLSRKDLVASVSSFCECVADIDLRSVGMWVWVCLSAHQPPPVRGVGL